jgi:hypothetical protein
MKFKSSATHTHTHKSAVLQSSYTYHMICCTEINLLYDYHHNISTKLEWFCLPAHSKVANITWMWHSDTIIILCKFLGSHSGEAEVSVLLGYDAMSLAWHFEKT